MDEMQLCVHQLLIETFCSFMHFAFSERKGIIIVTFNNTTSGKNKFKLKKSIMFKCHCITLKYFWYFKFFKQYFFFLWTNYDNQHIKVIYSLSLNVIFTIFDIISRSVCIFLLLIFMLKIFLCGVFLILTYLNFFSSVFSFVRRSNTSNQFSVSNCLFHNLFK